MSCMVSLTLSLCSFSLVPHILSVSPVYAWYTYPLIKVIKGYVERAKAYCDPGYLKDEMENIINVFEDNGYSRKEIQEAIKDRPNEEENAKEEAERGVVVIPNIQGFSQQYSKIARKHGFRMANKTERRVRDLTAKVKTPLGDKASGIVYNIPCKCQDHAYTGETDRM